MISAFGSHFYSITIIFELVQQDITIAERLKKKDQTALSELYDDYSGAIYGVIVRICRDEAVAQDLLQEVFIKVWQKIALYDPAKGKLFTWVYQIARNLALNAIRNQQQLIQNEDLAVYNNKEEEQTKEYPELIGSVSKLEVHHKQAIELVYFQGLTHREAHQEMGVPLGTFKSYVRQALRNLKDKYQNELLLIWLVIEWMR